jgi:hypothetical protein
MTRHTRSIITLTLLLIVAPCAQAGAVNDHGTHSEFFHAVESGLYWLDPGIFAGQTRASLDLLPQYSDLWNWATSAQVEALIGCVAPEGVPLEDVMGPRQFTIGNGGPRWIGYHAGTDAPDGWLVESSDAPDFRTVTLTGSQGGAAAWNAGAWLVAASDPAAAPRLANLGDGDAYFRDLGTGQFWCDPATFAGQTREQVVAWLAAHPEWRWATAAEVYALLGKLAAGDVLLTGILGAPQFTIGNGGPRWIGYYDQAAQPDGLLLESAYAPSFHLMTGASTQTNAAAWNAGAWVVSDVDPTPVEATSWGTLKAAYR